MGCASHFWVCFLFFNFSKSLYCSYNKEDTVKYFSIQFLKPQFGKELNTIK